MFIPLLHPFGGHAMLVIVVVQRYQIWVGLFVASLLCKLSWSLIIQLVLMEEAFKSAPSQGTLGPASEVHGVAVITCFIPLRDNKE